MRYCGLFATDGSTPRLKRCRKLIDAAAGDATSQVLHDEPELLRSADEEADDEDEGIAPSGCVCRSCHAELEVTGRLKGTPTLELFALARSILALLPTMMQWVQVELMGQLRSVAIDLQRLPKPLRKLLANPWWQPLELSALAALRGQALRGHSTLTGVQSASRVDDGGAPCYQVKQFAEILG